MEIVKEKKNQPTFWNQEQWPQATVLICPCSTWGDVQRDKNNLINESRGSKSHLISKKFSFLSSSSDISRCARSFPMYLYAGGVLQRLSRRLFFFNWKGFWFSLSWKLRSNLKFTPVNCINKCIHARSAWSYLPFELGLFFVFANSNWSDIHLCWVIPQPDT